MFHGAFRNFAKRIGFRQLENQAISLILHAQTASDSRTSAFNIILLNCFPGKSFHLQIKKRGQHVVGIQSSPSHDVVNRPWIVATEQRLARFSARCRLRTSITSSAHVTSFAPCLIKALAQSSHGLRGRGRQFAPF
jgi:hypothetical protein